VLFWKNTLELVYDVLDLIPGLVRDLILDLLLNIYFSFVPRFNSSFFIKHFFGGCEIKATLESLWFLHGH
jgi:hypothetical protein